VTRLTRGAGSDSRDAHASPDVVRIGIMGCASIARRKMLPALASVPSARATAIASRRLETAQQVAARFGGTAVEGYQALLDRDDVDAVYVPLPTGMHAHWVDRALAAGKHVLCEKPLTGSLADSTHLVSRARGQGLMLLENFMFLQHAQHATVRAMIDAGMVGEVRAVSSAFTFPPPPASDIRYQPELGGGALLDAGVYPVRAAQYFLGPDLTVAGAALRQDPRTGVDVAGSALLCSPTGASAQLTWGFRHFYRCYYEVLGSTGRISLERAFTPPSTHRPVVRIERSDHVEETTLPADDQFANVAAAFASAVATGQPPAGESLAGEAILRQAKLIDEIRANATWSRS